MPKLPMIELSQLSDDHMQPRATPEILLTGYKRLLAGIEAQGKGPIGGAGAKAVAEIVQASLDGGVDIDSIVEHLQGIVDGAQWAIAELTGKREPSTMQMETWFTEQPSVFRSELNDCAVQQASLFNENRSDAQRRLIEIAYKKAHPED